MSAGFGQEEKTDQEVLLTKPNLDEQKSQYKEAVQLEEQGKNPDALELYKKAADYAFPDLQRNGYPPAQVRLGLCFEKGELGVSINFREAQELYRGAVDKGDNIARYYLANRYEKGFEYGQSSPAYPTLFKSDIRQNPNQALLLYQQAAEGGYDLAQYKLACCYRDGLLGKEIDYFKALEWFQKAAAQKHTAAITAVTEVEAVIRVYRRKQQLMLLFIFNTFAVLASISFGIYLSALLVPLVISNLLSMGLVPWIAITLGIATGFGVIFGTGCLLTLGFGVAKMGIRPVKLLAHRIDKDGNPRGSDFERDFLSLTSLFSFVSALVGVGFGIYLSTLIAPFLITALLTTGIPYGIALFIGIATSFVIINASADLFAFPATLTLLFYDFIKWLKLVHNTNFIIGFYIGSTVVGLALGFYLSILVVPIFNSVLLTIPGLNAIAAGFIIAATSIALITLLTRLFSGLGTSLGAVLDGMTLTFRANSKVLSEETFLTLKKPIKEDFLKACTLAIAPEALAVSTLVSFIEKGEASENIFTPS